MRFNKSLICIFTVGVLALFQTGCAIGERYVKVSNESIPKAVMIEVKAIVTQTTLIIDEEGLRVEQATVTVKVRGSGVFISPEGHILTCDHLFEFDQVLDAVAIDYLGNVYKGEILFQEQRLDLALMKINVDPAVDYARIADPHKLRVGQEVIAVGNPLGFEFSISHGIISALNRDGLGVPNMTQSDAFLNPGNSGGPLFNLKGELVGINSRIVPPVNANIFTGLGFSVCPEQIIEFLGRFRGLDQAIPTLEKGVRKRIYNVLRLGSN
jgi:S1-C subfamily serine protease